jgi:hypothetical protein
MKNTYFALVLFILSSTAGKCQDCQVFVDSLIGTYTGDCKSGKANGIGLAKGTHSFKGDFKKGWPDGYGTYTWSNGNYYIGEFKTGKKEGKGDLFLKKENGEDSILTGFWQNDVYIGTTLNGYEVKQVSGGITRSKIDSFSSSVPIIVFEIDNMLGGSMSIATGTVSQVYVDEILVRKGDFQGTEKTNNGKKTVTRILRPTFPFCARFQLGKEFIDIEFTDARSWKVKIDITR